MSSVWVMLVYGCAAGGALLLLYFFRARSWYWHVMSIAAAVAFGVTPPPEGWGGPRFDLAVGSTFVFFFLWGAAAPLFRRARPSPRTQADERGGERHLTA